MSHSNKDQCKRMATDEGLNGHFTIKTKDNKYNGFDRGEYNCIYLGVFVKLHAIYFLECVLHYRP